MRCFELRPRPRYNNRGRGESPSLGSLPTISQIQPVVCGDCGSAPPRALRCDRVRQRVTEGRHRQVQNRRRIALPDNDARQELRGPDKVEDAGQVDGARLPPLPDHENTAISLSIAACDLLDPQPTRLSSPTMASQLECLLIAGRPPATSHYSSWLASKAARPCMQLMAGQANWPTLPWLGGHASQVLLMAGRPTCLISGWKACVCARAD